MEANQLTISGFHLKTKGKEYKVAYNVVKPVVNQD